VKIFDVDYLKSNQLAIRYEAEYLDSIQKTVYNVDLAVICTPIKETCKTIKEAAPYMKPGATLCEISSLKTKTATALGESQRWGIQPLSVHPMFGPDVMELENQTMVIIPIINPGNEVKQAKALFPGIEAVVTDAETHDSNMAMILSLPYFMNLVFARVLPLDDLALLRRLAGSTFTVQLAVTQSIVEESPELIESLIVENRFSKKSLNMFIDECRHVNRLLKNGSVGFRGFCDVLKVEMFKDPGEGEVWKTRSDFFKALKD
jgi:prephenate dehydrogenase